MIYLVPIEEGHLDRYNVNETEADADLIRAVKGLSDNTYSVFNDEMLIGYAQCIPWKKAYVYIYLFSEDRQKGYGKAAILKAEKMMKESGSSGITCCCDYYNSNARKLLNSIGYKNSYASIYMEYIGEKITDNNMKATIRQYIPSDYDEVHSFYAEAFHLMRISTTWFPNSKPEESSEKMKQYWAETEGERFVYEVDGKAIGYAHIDGNEIGSISISPSCQGMGHGKAFLIKIINMILNRNDAKVSLCCVVGNDKAYSLYKSLGFEDRYCGMYFSKEIGTE